MDYQLAKEASAFEDYRDNRWQPCGNGSLKLHLQGFGFRGGMAGEDP
jgi:hypothetical protein